MSRYVSLAALALALIACALIIRERSNRDAAIRRALQQREAAMVQRYAPMIQRMIEELEGRSVERQPASFDEWMDALSKADEAPHRAHLAQASPGPDALPA